MLVRALAIFLGGLATSATAGDSFIEPAGPALDGGPMHEAPEGWQPGATRSVRVATGALAEEAVRIALPDGRVLEARRSGMEVRGSGDFRWQGRIYEHRRAVGTGVFTVAGDRVAGQFTGPDGRYQLRPVANGGHQLHRIDPRDLPEEPCAVEAGPSVPQPEALEAEVPLPEEADDPDEPPVIDVLLLYTDGAISDLGGEADARLQIQNAMDAANTGYEASGQDVRVRTVGMHHWDLNEDDSGDLSALQQDDDLDDLRDRYSADLVALIGDYSDAEFCGVAWAMMEGDNHTGFESLGYSLTSSHSGGICLANQTLAHELGHNMGLHHDPANAPDPTTWWSPSRGGISRIRNSAPSCPTGPSARAVTQAVAR